MPRPRIETRRSTDRTGSGAGACTDLSWPARAARGATTWCPRGPGWHPEEAWILGGDGGEEVRRRSGKQRKQDLRVPSGVRARGGARTGRRRCTRGRTSLEMGCATCRRVRAPEGSLGVSPSGVIAVPRGPILGRLIRDSDDDFQGSGFTMSSTTRWPPPQPSSDCPRASPPGAAVSLSPRVDPSRSARRHPTTPSGHAQYSFARASTSIRDG